MIDETTASFEAGRFKVLDRFPKVEGFRELVAAMAWAETPQHAHEAADSILNSQKTSPKPVEIRDALNACRDKYRDTSRPPCENCKGTGWLHGRRNGYGNWSNTSYSTAQRCPCGVSPDVDYSTQLPIWAKEQREEEARAKEKANANQDCY